MNKDTAESVTYTILIAYGHIMSKDTAESVTYETICLQILAVNSAKRRPRDGVVRTNMGMRRAPQEPQGGPKTAQKGPNNLHGGIASFGI